MIIDDFKDRHVGQRAYVVGKGPSLDRVEVLKAHLNGGVVFCVNESIRKIELIGLTAPTYAVQQDSSLKDRCVPNRAVHFMNCRQSVPEDHPGDKHHKIRKVDVSPWNKDAVLYDPGMFGETVSTLTAIIALRLARFMGCTELVFVCFDAWVPSGSCEYAQCVGSSSADGGQTERHVTHKTEILRAARGAGFGKIMAWFPDVEI